MTARRWCVAVLWTMTFTVRAMSGQQVQNAQQNARQHAQRHAQQNAQVGQQPSQTAQGRQQSQRAEQHDARQPLQERAPRDARREPPPCGAIVPRNITAGMLEREVLAVARLSPTFRAQCDRIAAAPHVHVTLALSHGLLVERARTTMSRYEAGAIRADVFLQFGEDLRELLGHEFEHVLEQIDGVDLRDEVAKGVAWRLDGGAFETRRAWDAGVRVVREVEALHGHAVAVVHETR